MELETEINHMRDLNRICRICLKRETPKLLVTICDKWDILEYCLDLKFIDDDILFPQKVCDLCIRKLNEIEKYKKQTHENQIKLKNIVETLKKASANAKHENNTKTNCENNKPKLFRCKPCLKVFKSVKELMQHKKELNHPRIKKNITLYRCKFCDKMFSRYKLIEHMRSHTHETPFTCELCGTSFTLKSNLKRHIMRAHTDTPKEKRERQKTDRAERKKTENNVIFHCPVCVRPFRLLKAYNLHLKKHNPETEDQTSEEKVEVKSEFCNICNKGFKSKNTLKVHQLIHGEKTFLCNDCGKGFVTKAALNSHRKVHTGERPYTCIICDKSFAQITTLDCHLLTHSGKKPYSCQYCSKAFSQLTHLNYHLRTHTGERPYSCEYCGRSFALKGNLTVHVRTHTGEKPYVCSVCGKGFHDSSSMKKHQRNHKDEEYIVQTENSEYALDIAKTEIVETWQSQIEEEETNDGLQQIIYIETI